MGSESLDIAYGPKFFLNILLNIITGKAIFCIIKGIFGMLILMPQIFARFIRCTALQNPISASIICIYEAIENLKVSPGESVLKVIGKFFQGIVKILMCALEFIQSIIGFRVTLITLAIRCIWYAIRPSLCEILEGIWGIIKCMGGLT